MPITRDVVVSIVLLLFCGFLIWAGFRIRDPQFGELPPAVWPQAVSYVLTAFCLIYFAQSVAGGAAARDEDGEGEKRARGGLTGWLIHYANPLACFAIYFLYLATLPWLGSLVGGVLLVFALLSVLGGVSPSKMATHAAIAVISVGAMWALFTFGLRVLLPRGELFQSF